MSNPGVSSGIGPEARPTIQVDTVLNRDFTLIDVNSSRVAQHLADRGVTSDVISDHTLALTTISQKDYALRETTGKHWQEDPCIELYPKIAIGDACMEWIVEAAQADDWEMPFDLAERTKTTLDKVLTYKLQYIVDYAEPGAFEAIRAYNRGTNRMMRRYMYRTVSALAGASVPAATAIEGIYTLNPTASPVLMSLGTMMMWAMGFNRLFERTQTFAMTLHEVRNRNNPFEGRAVAAANDERGDFFTVNLTADTIAQAQDTVNQYRRYVLRA